MFFDLLFMFFHMLVKVVYPLKPFFIFLLSEEKNSFTHTRKYTHLPQMTQLRNRQLRTRIMGGNEPQVERHGLIRRQMSVENFFLRKIKLIVSGFNQGGFQPYSDTVKYFY